MGKDHFFFCSSVILFNPVLYRVEVTLPVRASIVVFPLPEIFGKYLLVAALVTLFPTKPPKYPPTNALPALPHASPVLG